ncbi:hypothetical protein GDO86_008777 [Hymenochirus boettgeri]|uniref:VWFD domain-containing protein n=1 Tax=Hymenochirus boettgeri TaxID=247094 RepID=A0A8T2IZ21_9PIPI|nr:hypothetical protein GDO86_008777 [Hymenochirus boettgeri]
MGIKLEPNQPLFITATEGIQVLLFGRRGKKSQEQGILGRFKMDSSNSPHVGESTPGNQFGLIVAGISPTNDFGEVATCMAGSTRPSCSQANCRKKETCKILQGKAQCIANYEAVCWAWGDPHYHTFDERNYDFQGTCSYTMAQTCGNDANLPEFNIETMNENRGSSLVTLVLPPSSSFSEYVCGLCGNYNGNPGDDLYSEDHVPLDPTNWKIWKVKSNSPSTCWDDCNGPCKKVLSLRNSNRPTRILRHNHLREDGPFRIDACRREGIQVFDGRTATGCNYECPGNSTYNFCGSACPTTCENPDAPSKCTEACIETCECNEGFVPSSYAGSVCGLWRLQWEGDNDLMVNGGGIKNNTVDFGNSWKVGDIPVAGSVPPTVISKFGKRTEDKQKRMWIDAGQKRSIQRVCHATINPEGYFQDCIFVSVHMGTEMTLVVAYSWIHFACQEVEL